MDLSSSFTLESGAYDLLVDLSSGLPLTRMKRQLGTGTRSHLKSHSLVFIIYGEIVIPVLETGVCFLSCVRFMVYYFYFGHLFLGRIVSRWPMAFRLWTAFALGSQPLAFNLCREFTNGEHARIWCSSSARGEITVLLSGLPIRDL